MSKQHLFERGPRAFCGLEPQRACAQPADRPRGDLQHVDALVIDAALGVNGAVPQAQGAGGRGDLRPRSPAARPAARSEGVT